MTTPALVNDPCGTGGQVLPHVAEAISRVVAYAKGDPCDIASCLGFDGREKERSLFIDGIWCIFAYQASPPRRELLMFLEDFLARPCPECTGRITYAYGFRTPGLKVVDATYIRPNAVLFVQAELS